MANEILKMQNITKIFGNTYANKGISLNVNTGDVHVLLGENGAGKTTLVNILSGFLVPDSGTIYFDGAIKNFKKNELIAKVSGESFLFNSMTILDNLLLGTGKEGYANKEKIKELYEEIIKKYNLNIKLDDYVSSISFNDKIYVELIKALYINPKILILDSVTTYMSKADIARLFDIIHTLKENGLTIIFVTNNITIAKIIGNKATVLRKGEVVNTFDLSLANADELFKAMTMLDIKPEISYTPCDYKNRLLVVDQINLTDDYNNKKLDNVSFDLYKGEILGIAGVSMSGQHEICEAISGIRHITSGSIVYKNEEISKYSVKKLLNKNIKISYVPNYKDDIGLVRNLDLIKNIELKEFHKNGFLNDAEAKQIANKIINEFMINASCNAAISSLCNEDVVKFIIGRELYSNPELLILEYPTYNLDMKTTYSIYETLNDSRNKGMSIIYIDDDLDTLMKLSNRILVLNKGKVAKLCDPKDCTKEEIESMMLESEVI